MELEYIIKELNDSTAWEFERGHALLCRAIPRIERSPKQHFAETLDAKRKGFLGEDNYHFITAATKNDVFGVATGYFMASVNVGFVNNIAVQTQLRSKGLGTFLRNSLIGLFEQDAAKRSRKLDAVLGEVEEKNPRLEKLVEKFGAKVFNFSYLQPPVRANAPAKKLRLYIQPMKLELDAMTKPQTIQVLREIYKNIYDIAKPETNHHYKTILDSIKTERYLFTKKN